MTNLDIDKPNNDLKCEFSYSHFENVLRQLKKEYKFVDFEYNFKPNEKIILLRHDVDISLKRAITLAQIENQLKINATYFVMLHSKYYSLEECSKELEKIVELGHKIGLHYDSKYWSEMKLEHQSAFLEEINFLKTRFNISVKVASAHNPTTNKIQSIVFPNNIKNAYDSKFSREIKYLSDSVQFWREDCICKNWKKYNQIQLLIHPEWWTETGKKMKDIVNELFNQISSTKADKEELIEFYDSYLKKVQSNIQ